MQASAGNHTRWYILLVFVVVILTFPVRASLQAKPAAQEAKDRPFVVAQTAACGLWPSYPPTR